jgi:hypothetical protein
MRQRPESQDVRDLPGDRPFAGMRGAPVDGRRGRDFRRAANEVARYWDAAQERVPAPILRLLVTLPWLLRRMPVPFWVPLVLMLLRRLRRRRAKRVINTGR